MNEESEPLGVIIFAGPNGSGKSTITAGLKAADYKGEYINADEIASSLQSQIPDRQARELRAAQLADERRQAAIREQRPFAFETVMSTAGKVAIMTQAKSAGYEVALVFVTLSDAELNVQRVANRVALGGHPVNEDKIRSRYHSAMGLLPAAVEHADTAAIFDNSLSKEILVARKFDGQLQLEPEAQNVPWVAEKLWTPHQERLASLNALQEAYKRAAAANPTSLESRLKPVDASHGQRYSGLVHCVTKHHLLQQVGANVYVIHDRALTPAFQITPGKAQTIQYAYDKGKIVTPDLAKGQGQNRSR